MVISVYTSVPSKGCRISIIEEIYTTTSCCTKFLNAALANNKNENREVKKECASQVVIGKTTSHISHPPSFQALLACHQQLPLAENGCVEWFGYCMNPNLKCGVTVSDNRFNLMIHVIYPKRPTEDDVMNAVTMKRNM